MKKALVTGAEGQDGNYLVARLLALGYMVYCLVRRNARVGDNIFRLPGLNEEIGGNIQIRTGDVTCGTTIHRLVRDLELDEIYNLAAQSHVRKSFDDEESTYAINEDAVMYFLQAIRELNARIRFYQASSSEMLGKSVFDYPYQDEDTPLRPVSPYGISKLKSHLMCEIAREAVFGQALFSVGGILFNHESPLRGEDFVTRKITLGLARILAGQQTVLELGNLNALRDWGYADEYTEAMILMLQQAGEPADWSDFVIATGREESVRNFVVHCANYAGFENFHWEGDGLDEVGVSGDKVIIRINPTYFRPNELHKLRGNPTRAKERLGWEAKTSLEELAHMMMESDLALVTGR